jgi:stearoyl-CoA desaturase (delta-9 desaturase)
MTYLYIFLAHSFFAMMWIAYPHRHLCHQTVVFAKPIVWLMKTIQWLSITKYYANHGRNETAVHIIHHMETDTLKDPHSPIYIDPRHRVRYTDEVVAEVLGDNTYADPTALDYFFEKYPYGFGLLALTLTYFYGWQGLVFAYFCSWWPRHIPTIFNYIFHMWPGYINTDQGPSHARNIPFYMTWLFVGEQLHANHHKWQNRADNAVRWWEIDWGFQVFRIMSWFGLCEIRGETGPVTEPFNTEYKRLNLQKDLKRDQGNLTGQAIGKL